MYHIWDILWRKNLCDVWWGTCSHVCTYTCTTYTHIFIHTHIHIYIIHTYIHTNIHAYHAQSSGSTWAHSRTSNIHSWTTPGFLNVCRYIKRGKIISKLIWCIDSTWYSLCAHTRLSLTFGTNMGYFPGWISVYINLMRGKSALVVLRALISACWILCMWNCEFYAYRGRSNA
jgi:hypothetical protein